MLPTGSPRPYTPLRGPSPVPRDSGSVLIWILALVLFLGVVLPVRAELKDDPIPSNFQHLQFVAKLGSSHAAFYSSMRYGDSSAKKSGICGLMTIRNMVTCGHFARLMLIARSSRHSAVVSVTMRLQRHLFRTWLHGCADGCKFPVTHFAPTRIPSNRYSVLTLTSGRSSRLTSTIIRSIQN